MSKIIVVGAGPSGVIASLLASNNNEVILIDGEDKILKKILLTGNGKCNFWNSSIDIKKYNSSNINILEKIISQKIITDTYNYLESLGIYPIIKNEYYYPYSNQASSIREILCKALSKSKVKIITNCKVKDIHKQDNKFIVSCTKASYTCDKVIISTGSKAYPKTGSDGSGYLLAKKLGHTIIPISSALAPLILNETYLKEWDGVRCNAKVSLYIDNKFIKEEEGEIQLTKYGISGICIFNLSSLCSKAILEHKKVQLKINFFKETDNFYEFLEKRNNNSTVEELLESIINYKLMFILLKKADINKDDYWTTLTANKKRRLVDVITNFKLNVIDIMSEKGQICRGGVNLQEINYNTLESKICKNLYFTGEILDVDGICGGFNLAFSFMTGFIVGGSI